MTKAISLIAIATLTLVACASSSKKYEYPITTNATSEIERLETEMSSALRNQVNVLSPNHYAEAREKLDEAKMENQKRESNADVLDDLGYARAHLDAANVVGSRVEAAMPEVVKARSDALAADAFRLRKSELTSADKSLKATAEDFESGNPKLSADARGDLHKKYLDVETMALKSSYLDQSKALIEAAKKMGAKKYAEATLTSAEAKYRAAERTIETDHNNTNAIARAANDAMLEAKRAVEITRVAKGIKEESPEEAAITLEAKKNEAARNAAEAERNAARLLVARDTIQKKNSEISAIGASNTKLESERRFNEAFQTAQQTFTKEEADVYRQGDNLVVRLKKVQFPTGRSELPKTSLDLLAKVKDVISSMGAEKVIVEGHTDAAGIPEKNQTLSEKRAETVAKYFSTENVLPADQIESKGFGDTKPLVSNKTKVGRAQNRRVDVVISPAKVRNGDTAKAGSIDSTSTSISTSTSSATRGMGMGTVKPSDPRQDSGPTAPAPKREDE